MGPAIECRIRRAGDSFPATVLSRGQHAFAHILADTGFPATAHRRLTRLHRPYRHRGRLSRDAGNDADAARASDTGKGKLCSHRRLEIAVRDDGMAGEVRVRRR